MWGDERTLGPCLGTDDNRSKHIANTAGAKKKMGESELLTRSLGATWSLLQASVCVLYEENISCIIPHKSFHVTHLNGTIYKLQDCSVPAKSIS